MSALRVLSCNLLSGRVAPEALTEILERHRVDIACPQELSAPLAERIAAVLPHGELWPDRENRGLGIACRSPATVVRLPLGPRDGWIARLAPADWPQLRQPVEIVNVNILAPHTWPYFPRRGRRGTQLACLLGYRHANTSTPRAVVGDFNATPLWPLYRRVAALYRDGVRDVLRRPPRTWPHLGRLPTPALLRIDHCFVSALRVVRAERIPLPGSDHYGICVDLIEDSRDD